MGNKSTKSRGSSSSNYLQNSSSQSQLGNSTSISGDNYNSLEEVRTALAKAGLKSSKLIVGIDFTKSNEWSGQNSFNNKCLHFINKISRNPYEKAISIIGRTLSGFDEDNLIPCFGFGDVKTSHKHVFSFYKDNNKFCNGFEEVLTRYREMVPFVKLSGPTSFAPIIDMAITVVHQSGGQYHVLLIITDGQVEEVHEQVTVEAIVRASEYPLSIVLVGVGDGPWESTKEFSDDLPVRAFNNFQFVNFTEIMSKDLPESKRETEFALSALMGIPYQYKATVELGLLNSRNNKTVEKVALPPPAPPARGFLGGFFSR